MVVIGAGQAGLTSAHHLHRSGFGDATRPGSGDGDFVVLDHDVRPGGAWQHRWPTLRLGGVHGIQDLPGMPFHERDGSRPASEVVGAYFAAYERAFSLPVERPVTVTAVRHGFGGRLLVETSSHTWTARAVINATGTWTRPFWPYYPGRERFAGQQLHTADYPGPAPFRGQHVIVVGGGISAVEHLTELSEVATTTWVTRRPPAFTGAEFGPEDGRAAVAVVERQVRAGLPPGSVVGLTGLPSTPAIRLAAQRGVLHRSPMFDRLTRDGVMWADGTESAADAIVWATGFRPAVDHLSPLGLRTPDGGIRMDGTRAADEPRLHLVGYGPSASTIGADRAGRAAVREITRMLRPAAA